MSVFKNFRQFLLRGNAVDLAVAFVIGAAFQSVVQSLVKDLLTPLISALGGQPNFAQLSFHLRHVTINYGNTLNAILSFLIVSAVVFFLVVAPYNKLMRLFQGAPDQTTKKCAECLSEIPVKATRCKFCGVKQPVD